MVSTRFSENRESDRKKLLASFIYDCAKMMYGSVAIGGISPILTGDPLKTIHQVCLIFGILCGTFLAYQANYIMKINK